MAVLEIDSQLPLVKVANQDGIGLKFATRKNHGTDIGYYRVPDKV